MKIAVIGGGISGYSTAIKLLESGKDVVIYSPEDASELATTSKACAIWMPFLLGELMTEDLKIDSLQSAMISWQCFSELEKLPECGISRVTHTEITRQRDDRFAAHLYANFSEESYIDSEQIYKYVHQYQTFVIEIPKYYKWLKERFEYLGGESCIRFLNPEEIKKLPEKIIFNCTGLGARELVGDKLFQPKKGQIILHDPVDITCSLGVEELAIIPRSDALIIGTLYFTEDGLLENLAQTEKLWDLAEKWSNSEMGNKLGLNGKISRNKRLPGTSTLIGQRPCRDTGYELSAVIDPSHSIYNNYGHGGSGVTLSWGCATKVASLFQNNLNKKLQAINPNRSNKGVMQFSVELAHYELSYLISLAPEELTCPQSPYQSKFQKS